MINYRRVYRYLHRNKMHIRQQGQGSTALLYHVFATGWGPRRGVVYHKAMSRA